MRLPCGLIGPSIFFFNWNRVVFSGVFTDSDSPFIKQMHASFCHFGLPWHAVGSGYEYTVSKGSDCGHCALVLPFGTYWFRRCNKSPHMDQLPKKKKTQKTKQNKKKPSLCKVAAWARTGTLLSASAHGEVEMLGREWLAWETGGLGIYTFRVKELHAHSQDWLHRMLWLWLPPMQG